MTHLMGESGTDNMEGGSGDDRYYIDNPGDTVIELANEGYDRVYSTIDYTLGDHLEQLSLRGDGDLAGIGNSENNRLYGNSADNILSGAEGNDRLYGKAGNDTLQGNVGNDNLDGGSDADHMVGGAGDDRYIVDNLGDTVLELADEGSDRVYSSINFSLGNNLERLYLTGAASIDGVGNNQDNRLYGNSGANKLTGAAGDDRLYGKAGDDILIADAGNDRLDGGTGADILDGGTGDDRYYVDNLGDSVLESANAGYDRVYSSVNFTLNENLERLYLTGIEDITGVGNSKNNNLYGNKGANVLVGAEGNDWIYGQDGNDTLQGDAGVDRLYAGDGNDRLEGGTGDDSLYGQDGNDSLQGGAGNDRLYGGNGADDMEGGSGEDRYAVGNLGDTVSESANEGEDRVYSSIDYTLGQHLERLYLNGDADLTGVGNSEDNRIYGNSGANSLSGLAGNDRLYGGEGDDTYVFARGGNQDAIIETDATPDNHDVLSFLHDINHEPKKIS